MYNPTLNLKLDPGDIDSLELIDELDSVVYPQELLEEYFTGLYEELAARANPDLTGIRRSVFIEVREGNQI